MSAAAAVPRRPGVTLRRVALGLAALQALQLALALGALALDFPATWMENEAPWMTIFAPWFALLTWLWWSAPILQRFPPLVGTFLLIPVGIWLGRSPIAATRPRIGWTALFVAGAISGGLQASAVVVLYLWA